jgi:uncharacterized protein (AIM24 family)
MTMPPWGMPPVDPDADRGAGPLTCLYCRMPHDGAATNCPHCGAPLDVRTAVTRSGWVEQPPIRDMARIQFGRSRLQIEGRQVPVADVTLADGDWIYFSHHSLLWVEPSTRVGASSLAGGWKRMIAGLPLILMEAHGPGRIALSDNHAGEVIALPLQPGQAIWVREHRFLTATGDVAYDWEATGVWYTTGSGDDRETHYPLGQFGDTFSARSAPGLLLLHSPGNTFLRDLGPGETLLVQPGAVVYRDVSVTAHLHLEYPRFQGISWRSSYEHRTVWLRLVGPGRVAVQSVFGHQTGERITSSSGATRQAW